MTLIDTFTSNADLTNYLKTFDCFGETEMVENIAVAGAGNMNVVLRVQTQKRSLIVKQSRPFVVKYPDIPAPLNRIAVEHQFYTAIRNGDKNTHFPTILEFSKQEHLLIMEDLGKLPDLTSLYTVRNLEAEMFQELIDALTEIHATAVPKDYPLNTVLRQLNHQHIFILPFMEDNGFSLDNIQKGLQALSLPFKTNIKLKERVEALGKRYMEAGDTLLHGDYYPGSWIHNDTALYVIDPEFSFVGEKAFDLGVLSAHLILATSETAYLDRVLTAYSGTVASDLVRQFTGVEIIRRLIGLAQLPLERSLQEKKNLLDAAAQMLIQ